MSRGLPGIRIDIAAPPPTEVLPRMDIAVFVGFAATGPTHRPVAVESVAQYAAIFGTDPPLAWDAERGERLYAYLGACVRAFFSNGGRRCWVIRVARTRALEAAWRETPAADLTASDVASANRFAMPGVLVLPSTGAPIAPAQAQARSLGAWSDPLQLSTALVSSSFKLVECSLLSELRIAFATGATVRPGDLIELGDPAAAPGTALPRRVEATMCAAFEPLVGHPGSPPSPAIGRVDIAGIASAAPATLGA